MPRNRQRAKRIIEFIELLTVPSGVYQGQKFRLLPFEKRFIRDVYEPHEDGLRLVRRAILSMGRKNGKTTLIACLVLAHLCGPEATPNGEIYTGANERAQAALVFKVAAQIIRAMPELAAEVRVVESTKTMVHYASGTVYTALSREAGSKFGLNSSFVIYDELAQARSRDLYDALDTSMGGRTEPLFIVISTQSHDPEHILSKLIDDGIIGKDPSIVCHLYETPEDADIFNPKNWKASNPALGKFRSLADLRAAAAKAKRMPGDEPTFRNLYLNQRVDAQAPLISRPEWMACNTDRPIEPGEGIYLGLDLSSTTDLCALVGVSSDAHKSAVDDKSNDSDRVQAWFWKPRDLLDLHETRDRVPYREWVSEGYIEAPPGKTVDYAFVAQRLGEIAEDYQILGIAYDRWRIELLRKELTDAGIQSWIDKKDSDAKKSAWTAEEEGIRLIPWGQGFRDMGPSVDMLETSVLERKLGHRNHPVLTWCISNAQIAKDPAGNRKLDKSKTRFRIDGAVALVMALGLKRREMHELQESAYKGLSVEQVIERMTIG